MWPFRRKQRWTVMRHPKGVTIVWSPYGEIKAYTAMEALLQVIQSDQRSVRAN